MGSKMVANYGLGPVVHGIGLFQPILSCNNTITISAVSDRAMMPDPAFYADCLQESFDELKAATIDRPAAKKKKRAAPKKKPVPKNKAGNGDARPHAS